MRSFFFYGIGRVEWQVICEFLFERVEIIGLTLNKLFDSWKLAIVRYLPLLSTRGNVRKQYYT